MKHTFISRLKKPHLLQRVWGKLLSFFFIEQWIIMISTSTKYQTPAWNDFKPIIPPADRDWADPFLWTHEGQRYIFIEEMPYSTQRGHIACLALDDHLNIVSRQIVLERPYHLSYPFLFVYDGQLYMMPETKSNRAIELYQCVHFPDQWKFAKTLMPDVKAVDATLINKDGKWWLFVNIEEEGGSSWDTLHLFFSDNPLTDQWTPHPRNPIIKDVHTARPAGHIMVQSGTLIRPSQDCSVRYGYATNFNHIILLNETDYAEKRERTFRPPAWGNIIGTHTWNELENLKVIDATLRRRKFRPNSSVQVKI
jgi:hypothetical protein